MRKKQCTFCRRPKIVRRRTGFCKCKPPGWVKLFGGAVVATVGLAAATGYFVDKFKERDQPSIHESIIGLQKGQERIEKILSKLDGGNGGNGGSAAS